MDLRVTSAVLLWLAAMIFNSNAFSQDMGQELDRVSQDVSTYPYHRDFKTCPISIDIAYLIDGSSSVTADEYQLEKTVVKVMAYFFGVMKLGTHNGVVNYGNTAVTAIKFLDHVKFSTFRDAVKSLKKIGGNTRIDRALESAHDYLFMGGGGARASPKIPKIAIVFTDGVSGGQSLDKAVKPLVNKGVIVFAIGIGPKVNVQSLKLLTPRDDLLYLVKDFLDLYVKAGFIARQICQHAQNRGDFGPKGVQGPDGPAGPKGEPGPRGMEGERGNRGNQGAKGSKGEKGSKGSKGASGIDGAKGNVGSPGNKGPKGQKGALGDTGVRGQIGDPGHDGDAGVRGPKGKPGPQGAKGDTGQGGENGSPGKEGTPGAKGIRGDKGDAGHPGAPGADGQNGSPGPKGQPGKPGSQGGRGANGNPGPKGDQGPRGDKGLQGYPGARGPPGKDGNPGSNGGPGYDGSQGPRGEPGPRGPKGDKGQPGADGAPGYAGSRGSRGTKGAKGADANQTIVCKYLQSNKGQLSMSCNDLSYTATDCGCSRGCGEWRVSADGQKCSCKCNTYVPTSFASVGVNCCRLQ